MIPAGRLSDDEEKGYHLWQREGRITVAACEALAFLGQVDVLKHFAVSMDPYLWRQTLTSMGLSAARGGQVVVLDWLFTCYDFAIQPGMCFAAYGGHATAVQWFKTRGCPWSVDVCAWAAQSGHLELLQHIRADGCPWEAMTCAQAAHGGHLQVLIWVRSQGCPWDERTCQFAAAGGHLDVLQWLRTQTPPCPWNASVLQQAATLGHLALLQWALEHGCPFDAGVCATVADLGVLKALRQFGCPWSEQTTAWLGAMDELPALQWALEQGAPCDWATLPSRLNHPQMRLPTTFYCQRHWFQTHCNVPWPPSLQAWLEVVGSVAERLPHIPAALVTLIQRYC